MRSFENWDGTLIYDNFGSESFVIGADAWVTIRSDPYSMNYIGLVSLLYPEGEPETGIVVEEKGLFEIKVYEKVTELKRSLQND